MNRQLKSVKITSVPRRQHRHHHSSKKKSRSKNAVHISISSSQNTSSINQQSLPIKTILPVSNLRKQPIEHEVLLTKSIVSNATITRHFSQETTTISNLSVFRSIQEFEESETQSIDNRASINTNSEPKKKVLVESTHIDATQDHHRKKKKRNRKRRCLFLWICLLPILLICIAIAITLGITLSQKPPRKIVTPSTNASLRWNPVGVTIAGVGGVAGANATLLRLPYGLAFDSSNTLHIVDYNNHRVQKLIPGTSMTATVAGNSSGISGNAMNQLSWPADILFDSNDNMYITDRQNDRVQLWTKGATSGITVAGINGIHNISFDHPTAILYGPDPNTIFIAATFSHRIFSYPTGAVVAGDNGPGNNSTTLNEPYGLVFDLISRSFIIPNYNTHNIVRWTLGENNRTVIAGSVQGNFGSNSTLLRSPVGIKMDPMGNIYVADSNNHRIQLFMAGQSTGITIAGNGTAGTAANQLRIPFWLLLDNQLNLYVSDTFNHRVQKFSRY